MLFTKITTTLVKCIYLKYLKELNKHKYFPDLEISMKNSVISYSPYAQSCETHYNNEFANVAKEQGPNSEWSSQADRYWYWLVAALCILLVAYIRNAAAGSEGT